MKIPYLLLLLLPLAMDNGEDARKAWDRAMKAHEGVPWEQRHILESKRRVVLHCNTDLETAQRYLEVIEKIDIEMEKFFTGLSRKFDHPQGTTIYIYSTQKEFMEKEDEDGSVESTTHPSDGSIRTYHGRTGARRGTVETLGREIARRWEATVVRDRMNIPPWLYRGLAICLGEAIRISDEGRAEILRVPPDRLHEVRQYFPVGLKGQLGKFLRVPRSRYTQEHDTQAWSLVHFIIDGTGKTGRKFIGEILADCVEESLTSDEVEKRLQVFGSLAQVEKGWGRWARDLEMPPRGKLLKGKKTFRSDFCDASITRPGRSWKWVLENSPWYTQVALRKKRATIELVASNNRSTSRPDAVMARAKKRYEETHDLIRVGPVQVSGYEAAEIVYQEKASENKDPIRTRRVCVTTVPHIIYVEISAPAKEFEEYEEDFEKVAQSLQLYFDEPD